MTELPPPPPPLSAPPRGMSPVAVVAIVLGSVLALAGLVAGVLLLRPEGGVVSVSSGDGEASLEPFVPTPSAAAGAGGCEYRPTGTSARPLPGLPPAPARTSGPARLTITTSRGVITAVGDWARTPCTLASFDFLAAQGYYDDTACHRVTTAGIFVLQCGDPTGFGPGGPGHEYADEALGGAAYPAGTLAMANAGPGTNGSQFFLVYRSTRLPPSYTPVGRVTGGLAIVKQVAAEGVANGQSDGRPAKGLTIRRMTVD